MSDQINEFDQIFRERLGGQSALPPAAAWENIQATRTFGHVVANRISNNWRVFGTLLMLLLAGGSSVFLFGEEEESHYSSIDYTKNHDKTQQLAVKKSITSLITIYLEKNKAIESKVSQTNNNLEKARITKKQEFPSFELIASLQQAGFIRPELENERLSAYIENLNGWGSARPKSFTRFTSLNKIDLRGIDFEDQKPSPFTVEIDWDYVIPQVERKKFRDRSSIVVSVTPHSIYKTLRADYNLSSSFLEDRKKAENTRLAYTASILWQYEVKRHRFIETGINFTQIYEEMSYEGKKRFSNQYNFIEIPVLLGFENRNAKWGWQVKGGLGLQVYNTYEGYILKRMDEFGGEEKAPFQRKNSSVRNFIVNDHSLRNNQARNEVVSLEDEGENPYKTSGTVNLHLSAGVMYYHSEKTSFIVAPSYKQGINSITKESALFSEKISYLGVTFGTRVKF